MVEGAGEGVEGVEVAGGAAGLEEEELGVGDGLGEFEAGHQFLLLIQRTTK